MSVRLRVSLSVRVRVNLSVRVSVGVRLPITVGVCDAVDSDDVGSEDEIENVSASVEGGGCGCG